MARSLALSFSLSAPSSQAPDPETASTNPGSSLLKCPADPMLSTSSRLWAPLESLYRIHVFWGYQNRSSSALLESLYGIHVFWVIRTTDRSSHNKRVLIGGYYGLRQSPFIGSVSSLLIRTIDRSCCRSSHALSVSRKSVQASRAGARVTPHSPRSFCSGYF